MKDMLTYEDLPTTQEAVDKNSTRISHVECFSFVFTPLPVGVSGANTSCTPVLMNLKLIDSLL